MDNIKGQYYRSNQAYLIRLYCTVCDSELIRSGKKSKGVYIYKCKKCRSTITKNGRYPYWHKSEFGIKE